MVSTIMTCQNYIPFLEFKNHIPILEYLIFCVGYRGMPTPRMTRMTWNPRVIRIPRMTRMTQMTRMTWNPTEFHGMSCHPNFENRVSKSCRGIKKSMPFGTLLLTRKYILSPFSCNMCLTYISPPGNCSFAEFE